jgi:hypothetical protein
MPASELQELEELKEFEEGISSPAEESKDEETSGQVE